MRRLAIIITLVVIAAACGEAATTSTSPSTSVPTTATTTVAPPTDFPLPDDPATVVLQIDVSVNQPDPVDVTTGYPIFTLYGDGRLIVADRTQDSLPGLPPLAELRLTRDGMQQLVGQAVARGALQPLDSYGSPAIGDADGTSFVVNTGTESVRFGIYALGAARSGDEGVDPEQYEARVQLRRLRDALLDYRAIAAEYIAEPAHPYQIEALAVIGDAFPSSADTAYPELPIDLSASPIIETRVTPAHCQVVTGDDLAALLDALASVEDPGHWTVGGERWRVGFRPLFPGDTGCDGLAA